MNRQMCKTPTIEDMRNIVLESLKFSDAANNILKNSKYLCDVVDDYRYEQKWQDKFTSAIYCVVCEDVRLSKLAIKLIPWTVQCDSPGKHKINKNKK